MDNGKRLTCDRFLILRAFDADKYNAEGESEDSNYNSDHDSRDLPAAPKNQR